MDAEQAKKLREPFPPSAIGKLPKPTKKDNAKGNCKVCGGYHGLPAVHLDYVGHAATTDRLLSVDPNWTWEPMALGPNGEPLITNGGLWIKLTVCGVTRPGFGDGNSAKEIIGDAIRNAAMRFGVALDLWAKEDIHSSESAAEPAPGPSSARITPEQIAEIGVLIPALAKLRGATVDQVSDALTKDNGPLTELSDTDAVALIGKLVRWKNNLEASAGAAQSGADESGTEAPDAPAEQSQFVAPTGPRGSKAAA